MLSGEFHPDELSTSSTSVLTEDNAHLTFAAEYVARLDINHAQAIEANNFVTILEQTLAAKKKRDSAVTSSTAVEYLGYDISYGNIFKDFIRDTSVSGVEDRIISGRITLLDALDRCLTFGVGQHGQNSFKYMLLCNLFGIKWGEGADIAEKTVAAFIQAIKIEKAKKNRSLLERTKQFIEEQFPQITPDEFLKMLSNELGDEVSESESSEAPKPSSSLSATKWLDSTVTFVQSTYNEKKHQVIDKMLADIKMRVVSNQITNQEALLQALTLLLGQKGPHSGKFKLVYNLIKHQKQLAAFGLDKDNVDANFARSLVDGFVAVIETMQAEQKTLLASARLLRVRNLIAGDLEKVTRDTFIQTYTSLENSDQNSESKFILKALKAQKVTVKQALYFCLDIKAEDSIKYAFLKALFGFNAEDDKEAGELVACFMEVLEPVMVEQLKQLNAEIREFAKRILKEKLPGISPEKLKEYCKTVLDAKLDEDAKKLKESHLAVKGYRAFFTDIKNEDRGVLLAEIYSDLDQEKITVLDAIYRCLKLPIGMRGEHSFRHRLTSLLFDLENNAVKDAVDIVALFIDTIEREQKRLNQVRLESVGKMVERFQSNANSISGNFKVTCEEALTHSGKPAPQSVMMNLFSAGYKAIKSTARAVLLTPIYNDLEKGDITLLEAFHQVLRLSIGEHGQHSFKFNLLKQLFGRKADDAEDLACIEKEDVRSANQLIECFNEVVGKKVNEAHKVPSIDTKLNIG